MIDEIHVRNLALIREATLVPASGLTVLTGETGAGKSALLSACKLLMGQRADKTDVREGERSLVVEGRFLGTPKELGGPWNDDPDATADAEERVSDLETGADGACSNDDATTGQVDDVELVVTRTVTSEGRSRATIDGSMASVHELAARVAPSVDLCGQHEHQQLMQTANHVRLLDSWAEATVSQLLDEYRAAFRAAREAAAELVHVQEAAGSSNAKLDEARFVLRTIDEVDPQVGELEELKASLAKAENAEALARATDEVYRALSGDEGALDLLNAAASALESVAPYDDSLGAYAQNLRESSYVLEDVSREARDYRDSIEFDEETLSAQQERYSALLGLTRKYGPRIEDVLARREQAADLVSLVDDSEKRLRAAEAACDRAESMLADKAEQLSSARRIVAPLFAQEVSGQMARLEMGTAELEVAIEALSRDDWTLAGPDAVEFRFRPGAGMAARPLARIASGGELSRVLLAVKVVMGERDDVPTLIFDEVDAGTGGATAVALADVLADLAKSHQVIVVTHLAQVAVRADMHYVVSKTEGDAPETCLEQVEGESRVAEIARMLSGSTTAASLAHARELLASR